MGNEDKNRDKSTVSDEREKRVLKEEKMEDPMLLKINEWLKFANWVGWYNDDIEDWK